MTTIQSRGDKWVHMRVPRRWISQEKRDLKRAIRGASVKHVEPLRKDPRFYCVQLDATDSERAEQIVCTYKQPHYRMQGIRCDFFVPKSERGDPRARRAPRLALKRPRRRPQYAPPAAAAAAARRRRRDVSKEDPMYTGFEPETPSFAAAAATDVDASYSEETSRRSPRAPSMGAGRDEPTDHTLREVSLADDDEEEDIEDITEIARYDDDDDDDDAPHLG